MDNHIQNNLSNGIQRIIPPLNVFGLVRDYLNCHIDMLFYIIHNVIYLRHKVVFKSRRIFDDYTVGILKKTEFHSCHYIFASLKQKIAAKGNIVSRYKIFFSQKINGRLFDTDAPAFHLVDTNLNFCKVYIINSMLGIGIKIPTRIFSL